MSGPATVSISDTTLGSNEASNNGGGISQTAGTLTITDPVIQDDRANSGDGGGIYRSGGTASLTVTTRTGSIARNSAGNDGGGIFASDSTVNLNNVIVQANLSSDDGGGIFLTNGADLSVTASMTTPTTGIDSRLLTPCNPASLPADHYCAEFRDNTTSLAGSAYGGAIYLTGGSSVFAADAAFMANAGTMGGGIYSAGAGDEITLTDCRFSDNIGLYTIRTFAAANLTMTYSTLAGNPATAVGINAVGSSFSAKGNIVWNNSGGCTINPAITVAGSCNNTQDNSLPGISSDPLFVTTARGKYHLHPTSPSLDACPSGSGYDLDDVSRPKDGNGSTSANEYDTP